MAKARAATAPLGLLVRSTRDELAVLAAPLPPLAGAEREWLRARLLDLRERPVARRTRRL